MMRVKTKCRMGSLCAIRKGDGECEKNCYYNTREAKTNADRIRSMSDEELAGFIANAVDCCNCSHPRNGCSENDETCAVCWLDWLKEEATNA